MKKSFNHKVKVYYEDTDAGGIVYYANYLKFLERARSEALSEVGLSNFKIKNDYGALIIVKSCDIDFNKSAHLEDKLKINSVVTSFSKTSITMSQSIFRNKDNIIKSKVHLVFVDEKIKPIKIPGKILKSLKPYLPIN